MNTPLSIAIENAKTILFESLNHVIKDTKLPAYLIEGLLMELVAEVRKQKNLELLRDVSAMSAERPAEETGTEAETQEAYRKILKQNSTNY